MKFTKKNRNNKLKYLLFVAVGIIIFSIAYSQTPKTKQADPYKRPTPTQPLRPKIPGTDRFQKDKVFLERADELTFDETRDSGRQVLKGNVEFRTGGMYMYCDSAYFYPESNSLDAFGNVRMKQGDTIEVKADVLYFDGIIKLARLRSTSLKKVELEHTSIKEHTKKYLITDSLDYDLNFDMASYSYGGMLLNHNMMTNQWDTLTSQEGQYSTQTKEAEVRDNVYLRNKKAKLTTSRLKYNAATSIANIVEPTEIKSGADSISTSLGWYSMVTEEAQLHSRSLIVHRDSLNNATILEGDSIIYDKLAKVSKAYMFRDLSKRAMPMIITDTAHNSCLIGGYGFYNDSTKESFATEYPLLMEYSRPDTIFLRADTIMTKTFNFGNKPVTYIPDSTVNFDYVKIYQSTDSLSASDSVKFITDSISVAEELKRKAKIDSINDKVEYHLAKAFNRARFFRKDLQGIADSMTFNSKDSMMYMNRKPIVWSGNRFVTGRKINVHFNDTTVDWAELPEIGIMAENIEDGFYNQLRSDWMKAYMDSSEFRRLESAGDVQTIFLPMEKDSTYNKFVNANSDSLRIDLADQKMEKLKMWPEVDGAVSPIFLVKKNQYYLPEFIKFLGVQQVKEVDEALNRIEAVRPKRDWYQSGWDDELGEVSDDLDEYFNSPAMGLSEPVSIDKQLKKLQMP